MIIPQIIIPLLTQLIFFIIIKLVNSFNLIVISSTYLRGLEVAELTEKDMPMV